MTLDEYAQAAGDAPAWFDDDEACAWAHGYMAALCDLHDDGYRVVRLKRAKGFEPTGGPGTPHYITEELT